MFFFKCQALKLGKIGNYASETQKYRVPPSSSPAVTHIDISSLIITEARGSKLKLKRMRVRHYCQFESWYFPTESTNLTAVQNKEMSVMVRGMDWRGKPFCNLDSGYPPPPGLTPWSKFPKRVGATKRPTFKNPVPFLLKWAFDQDIFPNLLSPHMFHVSKYLTHLSMSVNL